jgi:hypothetical protein
MTIPFDRLEANIKQLPDDQLSALYSMVRELSGPEPVPASTIALAKAARVFARYWGAYRSR